METFSQLFNQGLLIQGKSHGKGGHPLWPGSRGQQNRRKKKKGDVVYIKKMAGSWGAAEKGYKEGKAAVDLVEKSKRAMTNFMTKFY